jgi:restriction system protein
LNKKNRKLLSSTLSGLFLITSLLLYWNVFQSTNFYILFAIIITTPIIDGILYRILPQNKKSKSKYRKKELNKPSSRQLRSDDEIIQLQLQKLTWREFERLCFLYFKDRGYKPRETSEGADGGVDLIIYDRNHRTDVAIQIKHYINSRNQITVKEIRELNTAKKNHNCVMARFITSSTFTNAALLEADKNRITCNDINWVQFRIDKWRKAKLEKLAK